MHGAFGMAPARGWVRFHAWNPSAVINRSIQRIYLCLLLRWEAWVGPDRFSALPVRVDHLNEPAAHGPCCCGGPWMAEEVPADNKIFLTVECVACGHIHLVNPATGKV